MNSFRWMRRGLLVAPGAGLDFYTHASHPCIVHRKNDEFTLIFSMRDLLKRSHIFTQECQISSGWIKLNGVAKVVMSPGRMGTFDCEGLLACSPVEVDDKNYYFYYSGWNNLTSGLWLCDTGLAQISKATMKFSRLFEGPVMGRSRFNPYFAAATAVIREKGIFRAWYNSGIDWVLQSDTSYKPKYGIHYAESENGIDWSFQKGQVIPFADQNEHSFGRPTVVHWDDTYHMWFSCRGSNSDPEYKIGYASSKDGLFWERCDSRCGITLASNEKDFDSKAQSYPYVFEHDEFRYLLYSGNNYGSTGFGYAVLISE